jgi:hypothetical protein
MGKSTAHTRYYLRDKTLVPGCTTVLNVLAKPALVPWANKVGLQGIDVSKYVDEKASIGTLGHALVTDHLSGQETDTKDFTANQIDQAQNSALSFWEWEKGHKIEEVYFVERPLISEVHRFGGTQDIYCRIDGNRELIDLKTGNGIWPEAEYQVSALKVLLQENGFPVDNARIINIPRTEDEGFAEKLLSEKELERGWQIFTHCLAIYNLRKNGKGKP